MITLSPAAGKGAVSFPMKITSAFEETSGDIKFKKSTIQFTGTMGFFFGEDGPGPNTEGCYVKFSGQDEATICLKQIAAAATDVKKGKTDQFLLIGTGDIKIGIEGTSITGIAYLDAKGTIKKDSTGDIISLSLSGKIGGGSDSVYVSGSFKTILSK